MTTDAYTDFDRVRLAPKNRKVAELMADGVWRTPYQICEALGWRNPSTAASRLRDLAATGFWVYDRQRDPVISAIHRYRLRPVINRQLNLL